MSRYIFMFKPSFEEAILERTKTSTVRPMRRRLPHPGDHLEARVWTGLPYRSKQRAFAVAPILRVTSCELFETCVFLYPNPESSFAVAFHTPAELETFARQEGFPSWPSLCSWFASNHGATALQHGFGGCLIEWDPQQLIRA